MRAFDILNSHTSHLIILVIQANKSSMRNANSSIVKWGISGIKKNFSKRNKI